MNALSHLAHAEAALVAQIDAAAARIDAVAADALSSSLARLQAAAHAARLRLQSARQAMAASVAGLLADLTAFADDIAADLAGQEGTPDAPPAPQVPDDADDRADASASATVPTALGPCAVTVRTLPVPGGLLESLGMEAVGPAPGDMPAELENASRAAREAADAVAAGLPPAEAVDHAFAAEQAALFKHQADATNGRHRKRRRAAG